MKLTYRYVPIQHTYVVEDADGNVLARIKAQPGTTVDRDAAQLFAAAPAMKEALEHILKFDREGLGSLGESLARQALERAGSMGQSGGRK
ncbi:MAG: hypothetical protein FWC58_03010 [Desulfobulbus sp.]|nr:hypothetical protein [Desulfobulbus sp.]